MIMILVYFVSSSAQNDDDAVTIQSSLSIYHWWFFPVSVKLAIGQASLEQSDIIDLLLGFILPVALLQI